MPLTIKLRRSSVASKVPTTANLTLGEVGINTNDGEMFFKKDDGTESIRRIISIDSTVVPAQDQLLGYDTTNGWEPTDIVTASPTEDQFTATAGQTTFTSNYNKDYTLIAVSGVVLDNSEYTATNGTSFTLNNPCNDGDIVQIYSMYTTPYDASTATIKEDFIATSGQTDFIVTNKLFQYAHVFLNGVKKRETEYSISKGATDTTITLNNPANSGDWFHVHYSVDESILDDFTKFPIETDFTATAGQDTFNVNYTQGEIQVYQNGTKLRSTEFTATDETSVVLNTPASAGDWIETITNTRTSVNPYRDWDDILGTPTTISGYGITDAYTKTETDNLSYPWSSINTTPTTLVGYGLTDLDLTNHKLDNVKVVVFDGIYDNGTKSANWTMDPMNAQYQKVTLGSSNTVTITQPDGPCIIYLHVYQDSTGGYTLTLPSGQWKGGTVQSNTTTANAHDLLMIHHMGSGVYVFDYMLDLS